MLVSLRWLKNYVDVPWSAQELASRLTRVGAKVEGVHTLQHTYDRIVVGKIIGTRPHPDANTLSVCEVDLGGRTMQSVSGAPNVREGSWSPSPYRERPCPGLRERSPRRP